MKRFGRSQKRNLSKIPFDHTSEPPVNKDEQMAMMRPNTCQRKLSSEIASSKFAEEANSWMVMKGSVNMNTAHLRLADWHG